jgi:replicative DNA helicase
MTVAERTLPHNLEAERSILAAILIQNDALNDVGDTLTAADFFRDAHRRIFTHIVTLLEERSVVDLVTLKESLSRSGELETVGGPTYVHGLMDGVPRSTSISHYARIVAVKAALRRLIAAGQTMVAGAYEAEDDAEQILEAAERTILGLADRGTSTGFESMREIAPRALDFLERMHQTRGGVSGVPTGLTELDHITRGFQPGTLVIVGARPGAGKTSLALNVAVHAGRSGRRVGFFSLEMPNEELFVRQIAAVAGIDSHRLNSGYIGDREWARVAEAVGVIAETPIFSDETPAIGLMQLKSRSRRLKADGLDVVLIDYLQLMTPPDGLDNHSLEIDAITSGLKALAKELKIPIVLLAQLSRDHDKRSERPRLSDLKYGGEADADIVLFLYRKEEPEQLPNGATLTELIVAKHRNGPTGTIKLSWFDQFTRFTDYSEVPAEPEDVRLPMGDR